MTTPPAKSFKDLVVWQKAHAFVLGVYRATKSFPREEIYGLTSQFRRAAVSTAANIAEGFCKQTRAEKARFMNISQGSLEECRYYLILAHDLGYMENQKLMEMNEEVGRMLQAYRSAVVANHA